MQQNGNQFLIWKVNRFDHGNQYNVPISVVWTMEYLHNWRAMNFWGLNQASFKQTKTYLYTFWVKLGAGFYFSFKKQYNEVAD